MAQADANVSKWVQQYVFLRDERKKLKEAYEAKDKEFKELMEDRAGKLQAFLDSSNVESAKTAHGTVYSSTRYTASLADADAFMEYIKRTNRWDLLDRRANATAVREFVEEEKMLPPGCNLNALKTVGVRRANGKD